MRPARYVLGIVCALGALVAVPVGFADPAPATLAGHNGRIAFTGCVANSCDIYTVNPDGTAPQQITHNGASFQPAWSPDAKRIAYASAVSGAVAIWIAEANGGHARQLTPNDPNASNLWPRFMPNGKQILYTNCLGPSCDGGISAINVDGTGQHAVLPNSGMSYNLAVPSPDGKQIVYMRWHVGGVLMAIYTLALGADPRYERRLTPPSLEGWAPAWAPNGSAILFSSNLSRPNGAIYSVSHDERLIRQQEAGIEQLTRPPFPLEDRSPAYSPNGSRIVFASDRRHPDRQGSDLFTMSAAGSHLEPILITGPRLQAQDPQWGSAPLAPPGSPRPPPSSAIPSPQAVFALRRLCHVAAPLLVLSCAHRSPATSTP